MPIPSAPFSFASVLPILRRKVAANAQSGETRRRESVYKFRDREVAHLRTRSQRKMIGVAIAWDNSHFLCRLSRVSRSRLLTSENTI